MQTVALNNGQRMPIIGFGCAFGAAACKSQIEAYIDTALETGYRHFDTAYLYRTEAPLGSVLTNWFKTGKLRRDDVFVVTKLPCIGMHPDRVQHFLQLSLQNLTLDYVDLYLVHWPIGLVYRDDDDMVPKDEHGLILYDHTTNLELVWKAMESVVDLGLTKSIGLSNFSMEQVQRLVKIGRILPVVLQVETNVYIQQMQLRELCSSHNIHVTAFAPLGSPTRLLERCTAKKETTDVNGNNTQTKTSDLILTNDVVISIVKKHGKTPSQVALRFLTQQNISVIPKSRVLDRMAQNINSLDFSLDKDDIYALRALDRHELGRTFDYYPGGKTHPEYPFHRV